MFAGLLCKWTQHFIVCMYVCMYVQTAFTSSTIVSNCGKKIRHRTSSFVAERNGVQIRRFAGPFAWFSLPVANRLLKCTFLIDSFLIYIGLSFHNAVFHRWPYVLRLCFFFHLFCACNKIAQNRLLLIYMMMMIDNTSTILPDWNLNITNYHS